MTTQRPPTRREWWAAWLIVTLPIVAAGIWTGSLALRGSTLGFIGAGVVAVLLVPVSIVAADGPPARD